MKLLNKTINVVGTTSFHDAYGGIEATLYIREALACLEKHPVDMLVFEMTDNQHMQIRSAGYFLTGDTEKLDEKTILFKTESLPIKSFWFKVDDTGDDFIGTFLFPEDY